MDRHGENEILLYQVHTELYYSTKVKKQNRWIFFSKISVHLYIYNIISILLKITGQKLWRQKTQLKENNPAHSSLS